MNKVYRGVIIEESLGDKKILDSLKILSTRVSEVTAKHQTPDLKRWTLHTVEIEQGRADEVARQIARSIGPNRWYADFNNGTDHYIVYKDKIFHCDMNSEADYAAAKQYGISLGIPPYQVDFHPKDSKSI